MHGDAQPRVMGASGMKDNIAIVSALKSHKIKVREPIDERCWAYMKLMRETHATKRMVAVNPYAEVYQLRDNLYAILSEHLSGAGDMWDYLIIGPQKAMLIDTGFGVGDLKGLVNELTGSMPLIVVNTHAHPDHASGNCQFDRVFCHAYDVPQLERMRNPHIWDVLFDEEGKPIWTEFDREDIVPFHKYEIVGCPDGHTFDLGAGHEIELIHTAGHTAGHCMFLDKKHRLLFAGDDVISMRISIGAARPDSPFGEWATVTRYRDQMARLAARLDEFDYVFPGHFVLDLENEVILNLLDAANAIVADPQGFDYEDAFETSAGVAKRYHKFVKGLGTLSYNDKTV